MRGRGASGAGEGEYDAGWGRLVRGRHPVPGSATGGSGARRTSGCGNGARTRPNKLGIMGPELTVTMMSSVDKGFFVGRVPPRNPRAITIQVITKDL